MTAELPIFDIALLLVIGLLELAFAIYVFTRYERTRVILFFGFLSLSISLWPLTNGIGLLMPRGSVALDLAIRITFITALYIMSFLYLFALSFPYEKVPLSKRFIFFTLAPATIVSLLILFSHSLITGFDLTKYAETQYGPDYWIYTAVLFSLFVFSIVELIKTLRRSVGLRRWQVSTFLYGILLAGIPGLTINVILAYFFQIQTPDSIAPGLSILWLAAMWRVITRQL